MQPASVRHYPGRRQDEPKRPELATLAERAIEPDRQALRDFRRGIMSHGSTDGQVVNIGIDVVFQNPVDRPVDGRSGTGVVGLLPPGVQHETLGVVPDRRVGDVSLREGGVPFQL